MAFSLPFVWKDAHIRGYLTEDQVDLACFVLDSLFRRFLHNLELSPPDADTKAATEYSSDRTACSMLQSSVGNNTS